MAKKVDFDKVAQGLFKRTEDYADKVRKHYVTAVDELLKLAAMYHPDGTSAAFSFADNTRLSNKANDILRQLYAAIYGEIQNGVKAEWQYANVSCDALIEELFGKGLKEDNHFARWFSRNQEAMDSFLKRKSGPGGLNLSRKIWKYTGDFRTEMETAISLSMGAGDSASTMSRKVRQYLEHPDDMFRRFRVKVGEQPLLDEQGNPILDDKGNPMTEPVYGRRWKKKVIDPQTGAVTWTDFDPRDYHTGRGVYRSSYKNAMRLTRTETNMAYRTAEQDRWQRLDFVVGYEVRTSNNHPDEDICDILKGRYPKNFTFRGWHPQCRCYCVPILATEEEFLNQQRMILDGEKDIPAGSVNEVTRLPKNFTDWIDDNKERIEEAEARGTLPYFITDNKRKKFNSQPLPIATNPDVLDLSKPKHQVKYQSAKNVLAVALNYPELDTSALTAYLSSGMSVTSIIDETKALAQKILAVKKDEKYLSALIPDVHNWKSQFTSSELHAVYDAVEKKLASWASLSLDEQVKKLKFEAFDFLGGNMHGVQLKYPTWQVSQAAYIKKLDEVQVQIQWKNIGDVLAEAKTFATKSKPYLDLIAKLESQIAAGDLSGASATTTDMKLKREALKKAADARDRAKRLKSFTANTGSGLWKGGTCPFTAAEAAKLSDFESRILDAIQNGNIDSKFDRLVSDYHDYVISVSKKYYDQQVSRFTATELADLEKAKDNYLARPRINPNWVWGTDVGGVYDGGYHHKINSYIGELSGLTLEDLTIVQRFTNGSTFSNCHNLRHSSPYWKNKFNSKMSMLSKSEAKEMEDIIEEWSKGANFTLDRMLRYNGITFRGLDGGGGPELRAALTSAFNSGRPWINEASCSTSMKHEVATRFDGDLIMIIHNKTGAYIHPISEYSSEYEIMTLRGTKYKVLAPPKFINGRYYCELEEMI